MKSRALRLYHSRTVGMSSGNQRRSPRKMERREMVLKPFFLSSLAITWLGLAPTYDMLPV